MRKSGLRFLKFNVGVTMFLLLLLIFLIYYFFYAYLVFFSLLSLYTFPPKGALGAEAVPFPHL